MEWVISFQTFSLNALRSVYLKVGLCRAVELESKFILQDISLAAGTLMMYMQLKEPCMQQGLLKELLVSEERTDL